VRQNAHPQHDPGKGAAPLTREWKPAFQKIMLRKNVGTPIQSEAIAHLRQPAVVQWSFAGVTRDRDFRAAT
jgi:hypothetical protein